MFPSATSKEDAIHNLKDSARNIRDDASDTARDVRDAANTAGRKVRGFINNASHEISHASDTVTSQIRSNPVQSSAIALSYLPYIKSRSFVIVLPNWAPMSILPNRL